RRGMMARVMPWIAAAAVLTIGAWLMLRRPVPPASGGPRFVLLLYAGDAATGGTAEARRGEYAAWARGLASSGVAISGEELADEVRVVGGGTAPAEMPRGYFVLTASDLASAERIASSCPHLRHGGRIVVQRIAG